MPDIYQLDVTSVKCSGSPDRAEIQFASLNVSTAGSPNIIIPAVADKKILLMMIDLFFATGSPGTFKIQSTGGTDLTGVMAVTTFNLFLAHQYGLVESLINEGLQIVVTGVGVTAQGFCSYAALGAS